MSFFYRFVAVAMDIDNFENPTQGMLTPYSAIFVFSIGVLLSNFVFNTFVMRRPFVGEPVSYKDYFAGKLSPIRSECSAVRYGASVLRSVTSLPERLVPQYRMLSVRAHL